MDVIVEPARAGDIEALAALRIAYLEEDSGALGADAADIAAGLPAYFAAHLNRDLFCFVARDAGRIAACACLLVVEKPPSPAFPNGRTGTVLNVYTRPEYRRRGLARRVMRRLIDEARALELSAVSLKATEAGRPLYRGLGFTDDAGKYSPMTWRPSASDKPSTNRRRE